MQQYRLNPFKPRQYRKRLEASVEQERRADMKELVEKIDAIIEKQSVIKHYIETQFGGIDLAGNKTEGVVTSAINELSGKVKIQNGRIGKLEIQSALLAGGIAVIVFGLPLLINYIIKK